MPVWSTFNSVLSDTFICASQMNETSVLYVPETPSLFNFLISHSHVPAPSKQTEPFWELQHCALLLLEQIFFFLNEKRIFAVFLLSVYTYPYYLCSLPLITKSHSNFYSVERTVVDLYRIMKNQVIKYSFKWHLFSWICSTGVFIDHSCLWGTWDAFCRNVVKEYLRFVRFLGTSFLLRQL